MAGARLQREPGTSARVFVRAKADPCNVRKAKRWINRILDECHAFKGAHGGMTATKRNQVRRKLLRAISLYAR